MECVRELDKSCEDLTHDFCLDQSHFMGYKNCWQKIPRHRAVGWAEPLSVKRLSIHQYLHTESAERYTKNM